MRKQIGSGGFTTMLLLVAALSLGSCDKPTPEDEEYLYDFHNQYTPTCSHQLLPDSMTLYVDYTSTLVMKAQMRFYWHVMKNIMANKTKRYYAIKGQEIIRMAGDVVELLRDVSNYENPDLKGALDRIVSDNVEAMLVTDCEQLDQKEPFLKEAFKKWLMKGHDIYIISDPFVDPKTQAHRFMFYILFYDADNPNNIADYVIRSARLNQYPKVKRMKISITPKVKGFHGGHSDPNSYVQAIVTRKGNMEVQEWSTSWEDKIERFILNAKDNRGEEMTNGAVLLEGLQLDKTSITGGTITGITSKVFNINSHYTDYYTQRRSEQEVDSVIDWEECENFITLNQDLFKRNSNIQIFFDKPNWNPEFLTGKPYNYFKIAFFVTEMEEQLEKFRNQLVFDDIINKGQQNESVFQSVKQTIEDPEIIQFLADTPFYAIYVKSLQR